MPPKDALAEFANTYREWHYLVGGLSAGFVLGWVASRLFAAWLRR